MSQTRNIKREHKRWLSEWTKALGLSVDSCIKEMLSYRVENVWTYPYLGHILEGKGSSEYSAEEVLQMVYQDIIDKRNRHWQSICRQEHNNIAMFDQKHKTNKAKIFKLNLEAFSQLVDRQVDTINNFYKSKTKSDDKEEGHKG